MGRAGKAAGAAVRLVRGFRDRLASEQRGLDRVVHAATAAAERAMYARVDPPVVERMLLFRRAVGESTDIVGKEMFSFPDGVKGEVVALRPEGTAGVMRAVLAGPPRTPPALAPSPAARTAVTDIGGSRSGGTGSGAATGSGASHAAVCGGHGHDDAHALARAVAAQRADVHWAGTGTPHAPTRLFYHGPMFRRERPQRGRYRQFTQFGVECLGCPHPHTDAESVALGHRVLHDLGVDGAVELHVNTLCDSGTRDAHRAELAAFLEPRTHRLSATSRARLAAGAVLRVLDSKDPDDARAVEGAPKLLDLASDGAKEHFAEVLRALDALHVPYKVNHALVRGLDYYTGTVWEFVTSRLGAQGAVLAGGRYDGLAACLGASTDVPAVGWAAGVDRLALLVDECGVGLPPPTPDITVVHVRQRHGAGDGGTGGGASDDDARIACVRLAHQLRAAGLATDYAHVGDTRKQMASAADRGSAVAVLIGTAEAGEGTAVVKDMRTGEQCVVPYGGDPTSVIDEVAAAAAAHS